MNMIIIDADKILNIAGKRTFPVGIYDICNANWERIGLTGPCTPSNNKEFLFGVEEIIYDTATYKALYENAGVYYTLYGPYVENNMPWDLINGPQFFGYYQEDEPPITDLTIVSNTYNNIKLQDPNHPVILNHGGDMTTWYPYCDVITWDSYPFCDDSRYPREDSIYAYESNSND